MSENLGDWGRCKDVLPEVAYRTIAGNKIPTAQCQWIVLWDEYGDPFLLPTGRDPIYYVRKGFLVDKPKNPKEKPVVEKIEHPIQAKERELNEKLKLIDERLKELEDMKETRGRRKKEEE